MPWHTVANAGRRGCLLHTQVKKHILRDLPTNPGVQRQAAKMELKRRTPDPMAIKDKLGATAATHVRGKITRE